jgi:HAD superfamily 5'-nucleotidase-like hydrolase
MLSFEEQRRIYSRTIVDLSETRFRFLNTLFSISEASIYGQLVDMLDSGAITGVLGYDELHNRVTEVLDEAHLEGELKSEIMADPERFVVLDPDAAQAILDQHEAGKVLLLITNSEWDYTRFMMSYTFDRFLPGRMIWRDLFEVVIFSARKPAFFWADTPVFRLVDEAGLLEPCPRGITTDGVYAAGTAEMVERYLGCEGSDILFMGDHIYGDLHASKRVRRWRAGLVLRELEEEMVALESFRAEQARLEDLMAEKVRLEQAADRLRLLQQRAERGHERAPRELAADTTRIRAQLADLDEVIAPLARASASMGSDRWGLLLRAGNDKSHLARQIESHADIYTSRVSNLRFATPYAYFRSPRGSLPHDPGFTPDPWAVDGTTEHHAVEGDGP